MSGEIQRQWASDFAIDFLLQTSTTTRAEFKKQIDNSIRDK
jgi:hypothetical protein